MTKNEIILDALLTKASKLRNKAKKAQQTNRPEGHIAFLNKAVHGIEQVVNDINVGNITIVIH